MNNIFVLVALVVCLWVLPSLGEEQAPKAVGTEKAAELFEKLQEYDKSNDDKRYDLYDDSATIKIVGNNRKEMTGAELKWFHKALGKRLPVNTERVVDNFKYSKVIYEVKGDLVLITATKYYWEEEFSFNEIYAVGPDSAGVWKIFEEVRFCCPPSARGRRPQ